MLRIIVLGTAAGGGVPQWNCGCDICNQARRDQHLQMTQCSIAVSADGDHWYLINASPDIRQQITATPQLHPRPGKLRDSPIAGVILTNGEIDAIAGLLTLREGSPFSIHAHQSVLDTLKANSVFNVLTPERVQRHAIAAGQPFRPVLPDGKASGLEITPFRVPGKEALYNERDASSAAPARDDGGTLGLKIRHVHESKTFFFIAACADVTPELQAMLDGAELVFFDGTLWRDDELIAAGLSQKTGQRMGHISMSGAGGAMAALDALNIGQKVFLHINNSNPVLRDRSDERASLERAGWRIPHDGLEISL